MHVGVPGRVPGVDAASCKSVGYTGGTGDIFTNCHLLVFACGYLRYHVLLLCKTSYEGEYRIMFVSPVILPTDNHDVNQQCFDLSGHIVAAN